MAAQNTLYTGPAQDWYMQRLRHMYPRKPNCSLLYQMNHMLGTCPTCGAGKYATSKRMQLQSLTVDRTYTMLAIKQQGLQHLPFARTVCKALLTNAEYPLPIITYQTFMHIPMFIDIANYTVVDFMPKASKRTGRIIAAASKVFEAVGYNYMVFDGTVEIFKSRALAEQHSSASTALGSMQQILATLARQEKLRGVL